MSILNKLKNDRRGLSLIEVMVAILILGTAFVGLIQAFPFALQIIKAAEYKTKASYRAQEKFEELYQTGYAAIGTGLVENRQPIGGGFERQTEAYYVDAALATSSLDIGLKMITTTVFYNNPLSKNETTYRLSTFLVEK